MLFCHMEFKILEKAYRHKVLTTMLQGLGVPQPGSVPQGQACPQPGSVPQREAGSSHQQVIARPDHGEGSVVSLGHQGWWPGATMELRWGLGGASAWHCARGKAMGVFSEDLGSTREGKGALGNWELPGWICMPQHPQINLASVLFCSASSLLFLYNFYVYTSDVQFEKENFLLMIKVISVVLSQAYAIVLKSILEEFYFIPPPIRMSEFFRLIGT